MRCTQRRNGNSSDPLSLSRWQWQRFTISIFVRCVVTPDIFFGLFFLKKKRLFHITLSCSVSTIPMYQHWNEILSKDLSDNITAKCKSSVAKHVPVSLFLYVILFFFTKRKWSSSRAAKKSSWLNLSIVLRNFLGKRIKFYIYTHHTAGFINSNGISC